VIRTGELAETALERSYFRLPEGTRYPDEKFGMPKGPKHYSHGARSWGRTIRLSSHSTMAVLQWLDGFDRRQDRGDRPSAFQTASVKTRLRSRRVRRWVHGQRDGEVRVSITQLLTTAGPSALDRRVLSNLNPRIHADVLSLLSFRRPKEDRGLIHDYTTVSA